MTRSSSKGEVARPTTVREAQIAEAYGLLGRVFARRDVQVAGAVLLETIHTQGLVSPTEIASTPEFRRYFDCVWTDDEVFRVVDIHWLRDFMLIIACGSPEEAKPIEPLELPSLHGRNVRYLREQRDVNDMAHALRVGQVWLRVDQARSGLAELVTAVARGLGRDKPGSAGRKVGSKSRDLAEFEAQISPTAKPEDIHELAVERGLRAGPYDDPDDPLALDRNRKWALERRKRRKRQLRWDETAED